MLCYECSKAGSNREAIGLCYSCLAGLCSDHACVTTLSVETTYPVALPQRARQFLCATCLRAFRQARVIDPQTETSKEDRAPVLYLSGRGITRVGNTHRIDFYSAAALAFQEDLHRIEQDGQQDSSDWHLAKGLLRLTQGLQQAREEEEDLRKSFARSSAQRKTG